MKLFRRTEPGPNPDLEMIDFLTHRGFTHVPPIGGALTYARDGDEPAVVAMLQQYLYNQGNGWQVTIEELGRYFERVIALPPPPAASGDPRERISPPEDIAQAIGTYLTLAEVLGRRTGELHVRLADEGADPAFTPAHLGRSDMKRLLAGVQRHAADQLALLERALPRIDERRRDLATRVLSHRRDLIQSLDGAAGIREAGRAIRVHGDYHLGQVLVSEGDVVIFDFEGEPARPLAERRARASPLRDVAAMLRSFSYAALTALGAATLTRPDDLDRLAPWADAWETWVGILFLHAYRDAVQGASVLPPRLEDRDALLAVFVLDKVLYELGYELNHRPDWVHIPLAGLLRHPSSHVAA
jgi:maltose alpha-D-glucosyltransferase/alpha-amylase